MSSNKTHVTDNIYVFEDGKSFQLQDMIHIFIKNWYWFVISIILCLGAAVLYVRMTPKIYVRTASILIKDSGKNSTLSESLAFDEFNMFKVKSNIDNEILILKSERLMTETAKRLNLDLSYTVRDGLRDKELYTRSPIQISFFDLDENSHFSFVAEILENNKVKLSDFTDNGSSSIEVELNDTVNSPVGRILISPTIYYTEDNPETTITVSKSDLKSVVQNYRNGLQVEIASEMATILNLSLQDMSVPRAEDILNTLIAVYNEDIINDKNQVMINTSNFINERLIIIEKELSSVDSDIASFKSRNQLTDLTSEAELYLGESSEFNKERIRLENQLSLGKFILDHIKDPQNNFRLIPANIGIIDANIENGINQYNALLLKREKLISNSSEKNPVIMDINNSLNSLKQNIINSIDNYIVSVELKIKNIQQQELQANRRIASMPTKQKEILSVGREQKIKEELYLYLLSKREENALAQAITISNARTIDAATGPDAAVAPKKMKIAAIAFILGCILPALILWIMSMLNTTVRNLKDIENSTTMPLLGEIPQRDKKDEREVVVSHSGKDSISEAFRLVRTNIEFMQTDDSKNKVVMFTSFNPGAGKTFVSTNLALSFALMGKKVILLDLDIRKKSVSKSIHNYGKYGISNYLSGKITDIEEIIVRGEYDENLDVIHAGTIPPNPAELLLSKKLDALVDDLKEQYDYIFIDSVPAGIVADAYITGRVADISIYVIRAGKMERKFLPDLEKLYRQNKFKNLCLLLNSTESSQINYGYGYGYGYGDKG